MRRPTATVPSSLPPARMGTHAKAWMPSSCTTLRAARRSRGERLTCFNPIACPDAATRPIKPSPGYEKMLGGKRNGN